MYLFLSKKKYRKEAKNSIEVTGGLRKGPFGKAPNKG
jgi:hypothetical protein